MAISGGSGHVAGTTALPPKADLRAATSALALISSASPSGADLPGDASVCLLVTQSGHCSIRSAFALPEAVEHWSLTTLREKLVKIGAKVVRHARSITFQLAEVAVSCRLWKEMLAAIAGLQPVEHPP